MPIYLKKPDHPGEIEKHYSVLHLMKIFDLDKIDDLYFFIKLAGVQPTVVDRVSHYSQTSVFKMMDAGLGQKPGSEKALAK